MESLGQRDAAGTDAPAALSTPAEGHSAVEPTQGDLEAWLAKQSFDSPDQEKLQITYFPTDGLFKLYLASVEDRAEKEVIELLWLMLTAKTAKVDTIMYKALLRLDEAELWDGALETMSFRRLQWREKTGLGEAWEGMTWALELLPLRPEAAVDALNLYLDSQIGLPDILVHAVSDAIDIIRTRWIGNPKSLQGRLDTLKQLQSRKFEALIAALWKSMGHAVTLTPESRDGGFDVVATKLVLGSQETSVIECKRYRDRTVSVDVIRRINGIGAIEYEHAKRIVVTTGIFTKPAVKEAEANRRTTLIDGTELIPLLNGYLGADWPTRLEWIVRATLNEQSRQAASS